MTSPERPPWTRGRQPDREGAGDKRDPRSRDDPERAPGDADLVAGYLSVPPSVARHILARGLTPQAIARADIAKLSDPFIHPGVPEATERINGAIRGKTGITVSGDGSADATAGAATLLKVLRRTGARSAAFENGSGLRILLGGGTEVSICPGTPPPSQAVSAGPPDGISSLFAFRLAHALLLSREKYFGKKLVAVDTETTGTSAVLNDIIEIGAARIEGDRVTETFQTLINPGRRIPPEITRITGITNEDVGAAPSPAEALSMFLDFIGNAELTVLVAHNADFDREFIERSIKKHLGAKVRFEAIDTLEMARRMHPAGSHRLANVAERLGIRVEGWHRALGDAVLAANIYFALGRRQKAELMDLKLRQYTDTASLGITASGKDLDGDCAVVIRSGLPKYRLDECREMVAGIPEKPDPQRVIDLLLARFLARQKNQLGAVTLLAPIMRSDARAR